MRTSRLQLQHDVAKWVDLCFKEDYMFPQCDTYELIIKSNAGSDLECISWNTVSTELVYL